MSKKDTAILYEKVSGLVKSWGSTCLPNGKTLSEIMTIQGIPLWEMMSPELACYIFPKTFSSEKMQISQLSWIKIYLGRVKQLTFEKFLAKKGSEGCAGWSKQPTILFLGFNPNMNQILEPVVNRLSGLPGFRQNIIINDSWRGQSEQSSSYNSNIHSIWQHWNKHTEMYSKLLIGELKKVSIELQSMQAMDCIFKKENDLLQSKMQTIFSWLFIQRLPQLIPYIAISKHIVEYHKPNLIISADVADPRTRIFYFLGKQNRIPSLEIQYGLVTPDSVEYKFALADCMAVFGEQSRRLISGFGVSVEKITVTGSPRHDKLVNDKNSEVAIIRSQLGVPEGNVMVLFAATYFITGFSEVKTLGFEMMEDIFKAADASTNLTLVIKPHPILNQSSGLKKLIGKNRNIVLADPHSSIHALIKSCDVFISLGSTATLDALISNKLTITPAYPGWCASVQFAESGATIVPSSSKEIAESFEIAASSMRETVLDSLEAARNRFLHEYIYKADGKATDRIAEIAIDMSQTLNMMNT